MNKVTMRDVAQLANVSVATVSRVLRGSGPVASATQSRVRQAVQELHFSISQSASSLASGRTMRVGILIPNRVSSWFNSHVLEGVYAELNKEGYELVPYIMWNEQTLDDFFTMLPAHGNIDGIIVVSFNLSEEYRVQLHKLSVPCVGVDTPSQDGLDAFIGIDDRAAMHDAVHLLAAMGHKTICYIGDSPHSRFAFGSAIREAGFRQGILKEELDPQKCVVLHAADDIAVVAGQVLSLPQRPTALCVENDALAVNVIKELRRLGLLVPEDISVLGFDDQSVAAAADVSTIHQDPLELGRLSAKKALLLIQTEKTGTKENMSGIDLYSYAPTSFVMRKTVSTHNPHPQKITSTR